jgi:hypothetical protein
MPHKKFWKLSWYEFGLYVEQFITKQEENKFFQEMEWLRFRIQWADFRNANRGKNGKVALGTDLIRLSFDDRQAEHHEIDMDAMKKRFGSKLRKRGK